MIRTLCRWMFSLFLVLLWAAVARADDEPPSSDRVPAIGYLLAFVFTILPLVVICMPSRKA